MKKKVLGLLLTVAMVAGLAACGSQPAASTGGEGGSQGGGDLIKVGIINNDPNESGYRTANDKDLKEMFTEANGYSASFAYSKENEKQINAAQKFVQDEVDYLLLSAADTAGWDSVLKDAQAAGVKVILFDRVIDADPSLYEASIVSDMEKEGQTAVDWLAKQNLEEYNII
ncbi:MAG: substrate-binding domain-containing protein, partial [Lachnospiraceae bacterium]|nr:substrate-binding domain-containing protein [Lachnospiraceae bacterium]